MAFGAEPRPRHFQHVFGAAAVGVVTAQAIFPHRSMFEKERSPLFGMALVASVVDRVFLQHRLCPADDLLRGLPEAWRQHKLGELPIGRPGQVTEIAPTAVLLASEEGAYYIGATMNPNGGDIML